MGIASAVAAGDAVVEFDQAVDGCLVATDPFEGLDPFPSSTQRHRESLTPRPESDEPAKYESSEKGGVMVSLDGHESPTS